MEEKAVASKATEEEFGAVIEVETFEEMMNSVETQIGLTTLQKVNEVERSEEVVKEETSCYKRA